MKTPHIIEILFFITDLASVKTGFEISSPTMSSKSIFLHAFLRNFPVLQPISNNYFQYILIYFLLCNFGYVFIFRNQLKNFRLSFLPDS